MLFRGLFPIQTPTGKEKTMNQDLSLRFLRDLFNNSWSITWEFV